MKCKFCGALIPGTSGRGRCPDCGASLIEQKPKRQISWMALLFSGAFLFVGLIITLAGLVDGFEYYKNKEYYATVEAQIMEIRKETTYDRVNDEYDTDYTVFMCYTYDGVDYTGVELNYHSSTMEEGDLYQVEIDRRNPGQIVSNELWLSIMGLMFLGLGGGIFWMLQPAQPRRASSQTEA